MPYPREIDVSDQPAGQIIRQVGHTVHCRCDAVCSHCGRSETRSPWECKSCKTMMAPCALTQVPGRCYWCVEKAALAAGIISRDTADAVAVLRKLWKAGAIDADALDDFPELGCSAELEARIRAVLGVPGPATSQEVEGS